MMLELYDTLTRGLMAVQPLNPGTVTMYTCGPTVYRDAHIGNLRSYLMADWIRRTLEVQGLSMTQVKNITDVGHMRQEMLEQGEDKVIAAALAAGQTPQEIAALYTERFHDDERKLNIIPANHFPSATEHINDMIVIVQRLVDQGYAYQVQGNVYYDISRFPMYGLLSGNIQDEGLREGVRVEVDPLKRDPRDFTLWKLAEPGRELKWTSPWGEGFPGWHIECSAMSIRYLGKQFDIHTGGVDNIFPHHEGEIAQSEAFTGQQVVSLWVHGQHLLADGVKMAKSSGNTFTLTGLEDRGIDPLAFRYLCLTARFNTRLNFTFSSLKAAQRALLRLRIRVWELESQPKGPPQDDDQARREWEDRFLQRVNENLDMPGALALTWKLLRSDLAASTRLKVLGTYDRILGLGLDNVSERFGVSEEFSDKVLERSSLRQQAAEVGASAPDDNSRGGRRAAAQQQNMYQEADGLRDGLRQDGFVVEDTRSGTRIRPKTSWEKREEAWPTVSSPADVDSLVGKPDTVDVTVGVVASNYMDDVSRCVQSALRWGVSRSLEVVVVDNSSTDGTSEWLEETAAKDTKIRVIHTDHVLGEGAAKNIVLKRSGGRTIVLLDTSVEVRGEIYGPIDAVLDDHTIGVTGPFGVHTDDLHHFHDDGDERREGDVDAMQAYCFAFRRIHLGDVGMMRETFRFYRNLDLDYSFHFREKGYRIVAQPTLPVRLHEHRVWSELAEAERDDLSKKNFRRFLHKWGDRSDLLIANQIAPYTQEDPAE